MVYWMDGAVIRTFSDLAHLRGFDVSVGVTGVG